jgi:hypothetical protein
MQLLGYALAVALVLCAIIGALLYLLNIQNRI